MKMSDNKNHQDNDADDFIDYINQWFPIYQVLY